MPITSWRTMLTYLVLCISAYLVWEIVRAPRRADAVGYLVVSALIPLPVCIVGNSAQAAVFAIDVCLVAYIAAHGRSTWCYVVEHRALYAGVGALFGFSILASCSGAFNFIYVDSAPLKFYAFTIVKFWEYAFLATILIASNPTSKQLRSACTTLLAGILVYEALHALHISGVLPLSGEQYFGPRAAEISEMSAAPFSDRTGWFLASYRGAISGTASISVWFSVMVFEAYHGKLKVAAFIACILSVFSIFAVSDRSDIAGLAVSALMFALCSSPRRWKAYVGVAVAFVGLYAAYLTLVLNAAHRAAAIERISELWNPELRAEGSYADRSHDREALLQYLPDHPADLVIGVGPGNFHRYVADRVAINFMAHNSYLQWTAELGIGGLFLLIAWCLSVSLFGAKLLRSTLPFYQLVGRTCIALVIGTMVAGWGGEYLFGTEGMNCYSLYFVGVVYLLVSTTSTFRRNNSCSVEGPFCEAAVKAVYSHE